MSLNAWHGKIKLKYQNKNKKTQLNSSFAQSPFKIQQSFYPEGESICHNVMVHTAGGIVGGDLLSQDFQLMPDTKVLITTPSAHKIYRSNGKKAEQKINIQLKQHSILEYFPQEMILFNGANYQQSTVIHLEESSQLLLWELIRFGRTARGEKFITGNWQSKLEVWQDQIPLWIDAQNIVGEANLDQSLIGLNGHSLLGTLTYIGDIQAPETLTQIHDFCQDLSTSAQGGVTQLMKGLTCRYLGDSTQEAKAFFFKIWNLLRPQYLEKEAIQLRVW